MTEFEHKILEQLVILNNHMYSVACNLNMIEQHLVTIINDE